MTNLEKLIEQQRALKKQIRDAKRAAVQREREALARARTELGNRLAESMDANTAAAVRAIGDLLDIEQIRRYVADRLAAATSSSSAHSADASTTTHVGGERVEER